MSLSKSSSINSSKSGLDKAALAGMAEMGAAGSLSFIAAEVTSMGVGQLIVATTAASTVTVSLPAVAAIAASGYLGLSVGSKIVKAINNI